MSIDEARREAIINKLKELEEFLEPEGAHFVLHLFTSRDVTEESYSLYNNCSLKILAMSQARIENYIEQLGKISLKHHKENAAGLCDCCDKKKATYEVYCRISLGSFFIPSSYKNSQIYLCEPCLKKLSEKIAKQLQNEGD